jgi:FAD dependent oxidoreductase
MRLIHGLRAIWIGVVGIAAVTALRLPVGRAVAEEPRETPLVVYGATPAGIMTAVTAARGGVRVLLLEPGKHIGGMVTGGLSRTDSGLKAVIGGYAAEFFRRVGSYYGEPMTWHFEPHIARKVFDDMLRESGVRVLQGSRLRQRTGVTKSGTRIESITLENGVTLRARVFVDATYEGDLLAQSGVAYTWGREGSGEFNEPLAGVRAYTPSHQFLVRLSPFDDQNLLLPEVSPHPMAEAGSGDRLVQAYNFRLCMTTRPDNRVSFPKPSRYDARRYELLARFLIEVDRVKRDIASAEAIKVIKGPGRACCLNRTPWAFNDLVRLDPTKNEKVDVNNYGPFSTDYVGGSHSYPDGDYSARTKIWDDHVEYTKGFLYFLLHDHRVPRELRDAISPWGLCKDEFTDTNNWPPQLYIREGRRMRGETVMTQADIQTSRTKPDSIGMGSYNSDSHNVQRVALSDGTVGNEGDMQVPVAPYQIPYRIMLPKASQVTNLLVPVTLSATHVAYSTLRMEPQYMIMGQAAGVAAKLAIEGETSVQDVNIAMLQKRLRGQGGVLEHMAAKPFTP